MKNESKDHGGEVRVGDVWCDNADGVVLVVQEVTDKWVYHRFFKKGELIL